MNTRASLKKFGCGLWTHMGLTPIEAKRLMDFRQGRDPQPTGKITIRAAGPKTGEILIYEDIGLDWWTGEGLTAKSIDEEIKGLGTIDELVVRINSNGGDFFDGLAIYNILDRLDTMTRVVIDGLAASAASYIAMAGDTIQMPPSAMMMIHDVSGFVAGNSADMAGMADVLEKLDGQIAGIYAARTGRPAGEFRAAMDTDTWYTAVEAVEIGLADELLDEPETAQKAAAKDGAKPPQDATQVVDPQAISVRLRKMEIDDIEIPA